jgi:hypothetical protein
MPMGYAIDEARRVVLIRAWGVVTEDDVRRNGRALVADPRLEPDFVAYIDSTDALDLRVSPHFLHVYESAFHGTTRRAIVVSSSLARELAQVYAVAQAEPEGTVLIVSNPEPALAWIGLASLDCLPAILDREFGVN